VNTGLAAYTSGGYLPAFYVIHAVGPVWYGVKLINSFFVK